MADSTPEIGPNFRDKLVKAEGLRLSDIGDRATTDYAEVMVGDGVPEGAYGRAAGTTMFWLNKAAVSTLFALWATIDGGTNWFNVAIKDGTRYALDWTAGSRGKPGVNADIHSATEATREIADPDFEVLGTNATSACVAYYAEGGITLTTTTASGDQVILVPHLDANQSAWQQVTWGTDKQTAWECTVTTPATITSMIIWAGLKLTNTSVVATDDNQAFLRYEAGVNGGEWQAITSIANVDTTTDSNVLVQASTRYTLRIVIDASRIARLYINGVLIVTTTALTDAMDFIPYIGVQTATTAARSLHLHRQAISRMIG
jgi:hypothetical protein